MKKLFVVGDSISIQYGPFLKQMTAGRFHYDRKRGVEEALADLDKPVGANGGDSSMVLQYLLQERSKGVRYDVLLVNCGLHDLKTDPHSGLKQISLQLYRTNLEAIIHFAQEISPRLIWIRTTDADENIHNSPGSAFFRFHDDVVAYNEAADEIMDKHKVPTIDLYTFTRAFGSEAYCDHVHYKEEIRRLQAAYIAGYLQRYS
ncbi:hypothetical protein J40TS1_23000 [Paenibacillus montaniterrae]|uniref:SGNH hydrolase-type esterase domain-containing protein n=1 Tax=Paenibacillus montaniterrae TaxID=429341 RepID=A0A920CYR1_9BACL|nr:SGNH/GDSL hydrolase family protein [Paenibacillus montaniterrae]GIP16658.1 hypothetical protein J40TS1_23000 [Paenibacillus montaniterrae]